MMKGKPLLPSVPRAIPTMQKQERSRPTTHDVSKLNGDVMCKNRNQKTRINTHYEQSAFSLKRMSRNCTPHLKTNVTHILIAKRLHSCQRFAIFSITLSTLTLQMWTSYSFQYLCTMLGDAWHGYMWPKLIHK